eukprot:683767-Rhodomonas_salina.2
MHGEVFVKLEMLWPHSLSVREGDSWARDEPQHGENAGTQEKRGVDEELTSESVAEIRQANSGRESRQDLVPGLRVRMLSSVAGVLLQHRSSALALRRSATLRGFERHNASSGSCASSGMSPTPAHAL